MPPTEKRSVAWPDAVAEAKEWLDGRSPDDAVAWADYFARVIIAMDKELSEALRETLKR